MRCSTLLTGLISPESPTSPAKHHFLGMCTFCNDDIKAAIIAKSMDGLLL